MITTDKIAPIHPGEVLVEDFIEGFGVTQNKLAASIGAPPRRINEIVHGKRGIPRTPCCASPSTSAERIGVAQRRPPRTAYDRRTALVLDGICSSSSASA